MMTGILRAPRRAALAAYRRQKARRAESRPRRRKTAPAPRAATSGILRVPRRAALCAIAALVAGASLVSFAESYRGLYLWAHQHALSGAWAAGWPLQVDTFIGVGELALFVALVDGWRRRSRTGAWLVTLTGLVVSVAGNIGHIAGHALANRATAAVPPLAAASALAVGLGVLKRVVEHHHQADAQRPAPDTVPADVIEAAKASLRATIAAGNPLSQNQLAERFGLSRAQATKVRQDVLPEANGQAPKEPADAT
jgi:hypothetical protein